MIASNKRILIVGNYIVNNGGISGVIYNHLTKLRSEGFEVDLFNTKRRTISRLLLFIPLIYKIRKYKVVHIHGSSYFGFYPIVIGVLCARISFRNRIIVTYHGGGADHFLFKRFGFVRFILSKAHVTTVMSRFLREIFLKYNIDTLVLPNLIDVEVKKNYDLDWTIPRIVSIRSLKSIYNINDIIESFRLVKQKYPKAQLSIYGTGSEHNSLTELVAKYGILDVEFLGVIPNEEIPNELSKYNIMVSVPSFDNQPMSILEAFACGLIVISTNVGGIPYMIEDGRNGLLVDVNNPNQIADKIKWIMMNPELALQIIEEGRIEVAKYLWECIRPILFDLYGINSKAKG